MTLLGEPDSNYEATEQSSDQVARNLLGSYGIQLIDFRHANFSIFPITSAPFLYNITDDLTDTLPDILMYGEIIPNLPDTVLLHTYGATGDGSDINPFVPTRLGKLVITTAAFYSVTFAKTFPGRQLEFIIAGDNRNQYNNQPISLIYTKFLQAFLSDKQVQTNTFINDGSTNLTRNRYDATNTLGELDYLTRHMQRNKKTRAMSLAVGAHRPSVDAMNRNPTIIPISAEAVLNYSLPEAFWAFVNEDYRHIVQDVKNAESSYLVSSARMHNAFQPELKLRKYLGRGYNVAKAICDGLATSNEIIRRNGGL